MKNRLLTIGGALALFAAAGKLWDVPAMAQVTQQFRAALVKNIDEKGRVPYSQFQVRACPNGGNVCELVFPPVPAGKRLVVEHANAGINFVTAGIRLSSLGTQDFVVLLPARPVSDGSGVHAVNEPVLAYFENGQSPIYRIATVSATDVPAVTAFISGYLVDLSD